MLKIARKDVVQYSTCDTACMMVQAASRFVGTLTCSRKVQFVLTFLCHRNLLRSVTFAK
jgi:hypothetical protein